MTGCVWTAEVYAKGDFRDGLALCEVMCLKEMLPNDLGKVGETESMCTSPAWLWREDGTRSPKEKADAIEFEVNRSVRTIAGRMVATGKGE